MEPVPNISFESDNGDKIQGCPIIAFVKLLSFCKYEFLSS